jgi:AcrR family transcriptional regulator
MATADRRRAILEAVLPLLIERGSSVTTAEMAEAAGIAEGTIFRAFPDKPALIYEAVKATLDAGPVAEAIRAIPSSASMRGRVATAATVLVEHFNRTIALAELLRSMPQPHDAGHCDVRALIKESSSVITGALKTLFEPHREALRVPPAKAIAAFRGLIFASGHPMVPPSERLSVDEVVAILLRGIAKPSRA